MRFDACQVGHPTTMRNSNSRLFAVFGVAAAAVAAAALVVSWVVAVFAFATPLSGSVTGLVLAVVLFGAPALCVLALGLIALRVIPARAPGSGIRSAQ